MSSSYTLYNFVPVPGYAAHSWLLVADTAVPPVPYCAAYCWPAAHLPDDNNAWVWHAVGSTSATNDAAPFDDRFRRHASTVTDTPFAYPTAVCVDVTQDVQCPLALPVAFTPA